jgi:hypothetical protein
MSCRHITMEFIYDMLILGWTVEPFEYSNRLGQFLINIVYQFR